MPADEKHNILTRSLGSCDHLHELSRVHRSPRGIEENLARRCMLREQIEPLRDDFAHLAIRITATPFQVLCSHRIRMRVARLADVIKEQLHRTFSMGAVRRSVNALLQTT